MLSDEPISFNRPFIVGEEIRNIIDAVERGQLAGNGYYTRQCQTWLEQTCGAAKVLLTHSCTAALEMSAILAALQPGDEVIMPSYTFVSTANAFVLRGARPVFADIRPDTLCLDAEQVESLITRKTRAVVAMHYAGVACPMDQLMAITNRHRLLLIEDAAQGVGASYRGRSLGTIGDLGCYSFHETKNLISGEGGAIAINRPEYQERAQIIWEKGTNRIQFFRGQVDKYTWVDLGSSFLPSELVGAFLYSQLQHAEMITAHRLKLWDYYYQALAPLEWAGKLRRPIVPDYAQHNGHLFYVLLPDGKQRDRVLCHLNANGVQAIFHYVPLHSSPMGQRFGQRSLPVTDRCASRLLRLPCYYGLEEHQQQRIIDLLFEAMAVANPTSIGVGLEGGRGA